MAGRVLGTIHNPQTSTPPPNRYNIRFTLVMKDWLLPVKARGTMLAQTPEGVPLEMSGELLYEDGTSAAFFCSFLVHATQLAVVSGETASVQVRVLSVAAVRGRPVGLLYDIVLTRTVQPSI